MYNYIILFNRDRKDFRLERIGNTMWWGLKIEDPFYKKHTRIIFDKEQIYAVDPPGGPFLSVGHCLIKDSQEIIEIINTSLGVFLKLRPI